MYVAKPPTMAELFDRIKPERLVEVLGGEAPNGSYLHWDKLRHLEPPPGLTHEEWWARIKFARQGSKRPLPLTDAEGRPLTYSLPDPVLRLLHHVDQRTSGEIAMPEVVTADEGARRRYLVNSLMEEAIRSSQLEGARTSQQVAKELLRSGREPRDRSEQMILNNYRALNFMREELGDELNPGGVLELHRILTEGTLDNPDAAGRLQRPDEERVAVIDRTDGTILHQPPPAEQLPGRLDALCEFANDRGDERFIHPAVRALLLHFWVGFDHPFEDGNGRTARALFYWCMGERGYWLVEYLSISRILRAAPSKYMRSFLLTETDEGDTTYFLLYQLEVIERAIAELHAYLERKVAEVREIERLIRGDGSFNHRQLALLSDALRHGDREYTFRTHAAMHQVTHETARSDLYQLVDQGLLEQRRSGRAYRFAPALDLAGRLRRLGDGLA